MAFAVKIGSTFLDLLPESQISFEKNTELWVTGLPTVNVGSYSFPFELPLTEKNRKFLRFPDRVDSFTDLQVIDGAIIYMGDGASIGVPVFTGRLFVKKANKKSISTFLVVDGLSREVEKKFENVDMGVYYLGTPLLLENVMTTTTTNPLDAPFIFFPVINETLFKQYEGTENIEKMLYGNRWGASRVNHHAFGDWVFKLETDVDKKKNSILIPFLRLEVILEKIVEAMGYTLVNEWITEDDEELRKIVLWNNKSINDLETTHKLNIKYVEHMPGKMLLTDFLKEVCKYAFQGIFVDHFSKTITIRPYRDVLKEAPRHNWTTRQTDDEEIEQDNTVPKEIGFDVDNSDDYFNNNFVSEEPLIAEGATITDYWQKGGNPNSHSLIDGYYHVKRDNAIYRYDPSKNFLSERWTKWSHRFKRMMIGGRGDNWLSKCIPAFSDWAAFDISYTFPYTLPRVDHALNIKLKFDDEVVENTAELGSIRLMIYRGIRTDAGPGNNYPYANATAYDPATQSESFDHSLHYDGEKGIYKLYGENWMDFLKKKKIVTMRLKLTVADILNHKESDKVRIGNMNYFVKSMRINVSGSGLGLTECELVSIPFG